MKTAIQMVVSEYRKEWDLSLRAFAKVLSNGLPQDGISHQTIANWENGAHNPSFHLLVVMTVYCEDWRRNFAYDCLAATCPELYVPSTHIGRTALAIQALQNAKESEK